MGEWGAILFILGLRLNSIRMKQRHMINVHVILQSSDQVCRFWPLGYVVSIYLSPSSCSISLSPSLLSRPQDKLRMSNNEIIDITLNSEREREREREREAARVHWIVTKIERQREN